MGHTSAPAQAPTGCAECDGGACGAAAAGVASRSGVRPAVWGWSTADGSSASAGAGSGLCRKSADHPRGQGQQGPGHGVPQKPDGAAPDPSAGRETTASAGSGSWLGTGVPAGGTGAEIHLSLT